MAAPSSLHPEAPYRIEKIPGKGNGVIAKRPIQTGEIVMTESAILKLPKGSEHRMDYETSQLKLQLKKLPKHLQARVLSFHAAGGYSNRHRIQDIFYTNCYNGPNNIKMMYADISYTNHSCKPNVQIVFDMKSEQSILRALRDVAEGEELLIDYRDSTEDSVMRGRVFKEKYGFECDCLRCSSPADTIEQRDKMLFRLRALESLPNIPDRETGLRVLRESAQLYRDLEILGSALCDFLIAATSLMCTLQLFDRAAVLAMVTKRALAIFSLRGSDQWRALRDSLERDESWKEVRQVSRDLSKNRGIWWIINEDDEWAGTNWAKWLWDDEHQGEN